MDRVFLMRLHLTANAIEDTLFNGRKTLWDSGMKSEMKHRQLDQSMQDCSGHTGAKLVIFLLVLLITLQRKCLQSPQGWCLGTDEKANSKSVIFYIKVSRMWVERKPGPDSRVWVGFFHSVWQRCALTHICTVGCIYVIKTFFRKSNWKIKLANKSAKSCF